MNKICVCVLRDVYFMFVQHKAVGIHYITWCGKIIAAKNSHRNLCGQKSPQLSSPNSQLAKDVKKNEFKKIVVYLYLSVVL